MFAKYLLRTLIKTKAEKYSCESGSPEPGATQEFHLLLPQRNKYIKSYSRSIRIGCAMVFEGALLDCSLLEVDTVHLVHGDMVTQVRTQDLV